MAPIASLAHDGSADVPHEDEAMAVDPSLDDHSDLDSAWGGDIESETQSLSSSVLAFRYENGRRYHAYKEGSYWGPNDEAQNEQLDTAHYVFSLLFDGKLYFAPIGSEPQRVLDVGTGTGIWAMDFADQFPNAQVIGTDLSPTQPQWVPPNCHFEIDDADSEWTFKKSSFDYVHARALYGCIADWPSFYKQAYDHLKPGAWYEQVEYSVAWVADDGSVPEGHVFHRWNEIFLAAGEKMGKTFRILDLQKNYVEQAGFVNVSETRYKMPLGPWPKDPKLRDVGRWHLLECYQGIEGWGVAILTRLMGWSYEEVQLFLAEVRDAFKDRSVHAYTAVSVVCGQKPPSASR